ncbi:MAG: HDOD domain-containing protein [Betaproteobacteria bacterium]|nr:HDOD domain-containing protein [Betaproteobacteria bacterium]
MATSTLLAHWVNTLVEARLPVLARTLSEFARLHADEEGTPQQIAQVVLHDPVMTVKVLQFLQQHRSRHRSADITTIAHALMMLGTSPFFAHFCEQSSIESRLAGQSAALNGVLAVMSRARHAALYAHEWARLRHDVDPEEIMIAALLYDVAEMMLWCFAPVLALEIAERQHNDHTLRSDQAQRAVLGFRLLDLQLELVRAWQLPELLHVLMDETRTRNPRVRNVALAAAVARHSAHGWENPALPHDFAQIAELLACSTDEVTARIDKVAAHAATEWEWYGVPPPVPRASEPVTNPDSNA